MTHTSKQIAGFETSQIDTSFSHQGLCPIAEATISGLANGYSVEQMKEIRQSLALDLVLDPAEVAARSAWVKIHCDRLLQQFELAPRVSRDSLIEGFAYCRLASSSTEYKQNISDFAAHSGIAVATLETIFSELTQRLAADPDLLPSQSSGTYVNYGFRIKELWRAAWVAFLKEHFTPEELARARVLCFPSIHAEREVNQYLALGIRPENIVGVEGGDKLARKLFMLSASKLGITPALGRLEDLLPKRQAPFDKPFDIVNLDFIGPVCDSTFDIVHYLLLNKKAVFCGNFLAAREAAKTQKDASKLYNIVFNGGALLEAEARRHQIFGANGSAAATEVATTLNRKLDDLPLNPASAIRGDFYDAVWPFEIGILTPEQAPYYATLREAVRTSARFAGKSRGDIDSSVCGCYDEAVKSATATFVPIMYGLKLRDPKATSYEILYVSYLNSLFARHVEIQTMKRYTYRSEASERGSRFNSAFLSIRNECEFTKSDRKVAAFFLPVMTQLVEDMLRVQGGESEARFEFQIRDRHLRPKIPGDGSARSDRLTFLVNDRYHSDLQTGFLSDCANNWISKQATNKLNFSNFIPQIPQIEIG